MGKILDFTEYKPHKVSEVVCLKCLKRWIAVRPFETKLIALQCPGCKMQGYAIETGEEIDEDEYGV